MYYRICPNCGASLDPGEICDCMSEREIRERKIEENLIEDENGQMVLRIGKEVRRIEKETA